MIRNEFFKHNNRLWILSVAFPLFLNAFLYLDLTFRYQGYLLIHQAEYGLTNWQLIFKEQTIFYFSELYYIFLIIIIYEIFSIEFKNEAWFLLVCSPFRNRLILKNKIIVSIIYSQLFWISDYLSLMLVGKIIDNQLTFDFMLFTKSFIIQNLSAVVIIFFYFIILLIGQRITSIIPIGIAMMILSISFYYPRNEFRLFLPFTYISHGFRTSVTEFYMIVASNAVIIMILSVLIKKYQYRSYEFSFK